MTALTPPPEWMKRGLCAIDRETGLTESGEKPDLWFPDHTGPQGRIAKSYCRKCPVRDQCLQYALDKREVWGVWGGTTERERHDLMARPACTECGATLIGVRRTYCSDACYDIGHPRAVNAANRRKRRRGNAA